MILYTNVALPHNHIARSVPTLSIINADQDPRLYSSCAIVLVENDAELLSAQTILRGIPAAFRILSDPNARLTWNQPLPISQHPMFAIVIDELKSVQSSISC